MTIKKAPYKVESHQNYPESEVEKHLVEMPVQKRCYFCGEEDTETFYLSHRVCHSKDCMFQTRILCVVKELMRITEMVNGLQALARNAGQDILDYTSQRVEKEVQEFRKGIYRLV